MMTLRTQWRQARRAARDGGERQNPALRERIRTAAERLRARIQRNNRTAMQAVNRLLTPPQRAQLRAIVQERRERDAAPPAGRDSDAGGGD
jgi:mono/diheme cytochrome c family protein